MGVPKTVVGAGGAGSHIASVTKLPGPLPSDPVALWSMVIEACSKQHRMRMLVGNMRLVGVEDDRALLEVSDEMRGAAQSAERDLCTLLSVAWGQEFRVELMGGAGAAPPPRGVATAKANEDATLAEEQPVADSPIRTPITDHPLVKRAIELFGARVVGTQPRRRLPE